MPSKSFKLLVVFGLTFLLEMYFTIKLRESLILFISDAMCLIEP